MNQSIGIGDQFFMCLDAIVGIDRVFVVLLSIWCEHPSRDSTYGFKRTISPLFQMLQWRFEFVF